MAWKREKIKLASKDGCTEMDGVTQGGLGMVILRPVKSLLGPPPQIAVIHLGSGHQIALIEADYGKAAEITAELLACGDWEFNGLEGYNNQSPEIVEKMDKVLIRHHRHLVFNGRGTNPKLAVAIARERD